MKRTFILVGAASCILTGSLVAGCGDDTGEGGGTTGTTSGGTQAGPTNGSSGSGNGNSTTNNGSTTGTGSPASTTTTAAGGMFDCTPPDMTAFELDRQEIGMYDNPVLVTFAPGDNQHIFIVEKTGAIIVNDGTADVGTFLDIGGQITTNGEQGVLGLAFHPDYAQNGRFFVHYSAQGNGDSTIQEFKRSDADPLVADPVPVQLVLISPTAQGNHNGGAIDFGPDGYLYISLGDGGSQGDPECDAQILDSSMGGDPDIEGPDYLGKIMRVDVNGAPDANGYPAAMGNPNGHKAYHIGFRNPWRSSFDPCTGDLYVGDVGQNEYEEVSVVTPAEGARNFGWPYREANTDYGGQSCPPNPGNLLEPILQYTHGGGRCSIVGGYVYRGAAIPGLRGTYFYADTCAGTVWTATKDGGGAWTETERPTLESDFPGGYNYTSFGQDAQGNLYLTDINGPVYRIVPQQ